MRKIIPAANGLTVQDGMGTLRHAVKNRSPKKGTKTKQKGVNHDSDGNESKKQIPEKGDENAGTLRLTAIPSRCKKQIPEKGDENVNIAHCRTSPLTILVKNRSPKKGTKTTARADNVRKVAVKNRSPKKGTKTHPTLPRPSAEITIHVKNRSPKKGTKTLLMAVIQKESRFDAVKNRSPKKGTKTPTAKSSLRRGLDE